jgi:hypothetical protein
LSVEGLWLATGCVCCVDSAVCADCVGETTADGGCCWAQPVTLRILSIVTDRIVPLLLVIVRIFSEGFIVEFSSITDAITTRRRSQETQGRRQKAKGIREEVFLSCVTRASAFVGGSDESYERY